MKNDKIKPYFIGITGASASGKTSIAHSIAESFGDAVPIISLDWYYLPLEDKSMGCTHNWDSPTAFNWNLLSASLDAWNQGESVWTPRHDYANYEQIDNVERIPSAPVMILEGILTLHEECIRNKLDLKIFVECDPDVTLKRRIIRDNKVRKYDLELILDRYEKHVKPAFEQWILPTKKFADVILSNGYYALEDHKGIELIRTFVQSKL